ncbi:MULTISPECIES: isochorismatase family cysteine hydrolase [unclassified Clostridium]|uniref:isochorismatase family cysteine hydrolase n=1 Tax=unclassified Clostridium TaxID=2614128 RepID=UPI0002986153|nr:MULTISPECIES: isochorismatase family cysteine hydrolase [unclassified Clostridium]EKQ54481.1 MAG: nicotinamidase-like amidase [Clostridium sp. Maddingley MBC34-26]
MNKVKAKYTFIRICAVSIVILFGIYLKPITFLLVSSPLLIRFAFFFATSRGREITNYENPKQALIIMDIQEDICGENGIYKDYLNFLDKVNNSISYAQKMNYKIIYICQEFSIIELPFAALVTGGRLLANQAGTKLSRYLQTTDGKIFVKHQQDAFTSEEFSKYLVENEIDTVYLAGLDAASCVYKTALGALKRKYKVNIVKDAISTPNSIVMKHMIRKYIKKGIKIVELK